MITVFLHELYKILRSKIYYIDEKTENNIPLIDVDCSFLHLNYGSVFHFLCDIIDIDMLFISTTYIIMMGYINRYFKLLLHNISVLSTMKKQYV